MLHKMLSHLRYPDCENVKCKVPNWSVIVDNFTGVWKFHRMQHISLSHLRIPNLGLFDHINCSCLACHFTNDILRASPANIMSLAPQPPARRIRSISSQVFTALCNNTRTARPRGHLHRHSWSRKKEIRSPKVLSHRDIRFLQSLQSVLSRSMGREDVQGDPNARFGFGDGGSLPAMALHWRTLRIRRHRPHEHKPCWRGGEQQSQADKYFAPLLELASLADMPQDQEYGIVVVDKLLRIKDRLNRKPKLFDSQFTYAMLPSQNGMKRLLVEWYAHEVVLSTFKLVPQTSKPNSWLTSFYRCARP